MSKVAVVTGSTRGIGAAIARRIAADGLKVVVNGRDPSAGEQYAQDLRRDGADAVFVAGDVLDFGSMTDLMEKVKVDHGPIDQLVTSGTVSEDKPSVAFFAESDPDTYVGWAHRVWASRLYAVKAALPQMIDNGGGSVVMLSTDAGRWPTPGESIPGGAAAALHMSARTMSREFNRWKVRVNVVATSIVGDSPGGERAKSVNAAKVFAKALARQAYPLTSDDVAEAVAFLASDRARSITGQILSVNGGVSVGL